MHNTAAVVFLDIDAFLTDRGRPLFRIEEFLAELDERGIPCVWLSERSRAQLDEPRRRLGHNAPFIGESGSGVYLPEDYFHLKAAKRVRLGRFVCIPIAEVQPAAEEALERLAEESGVSVVPLRSLRPRELAQNTGLPSREAELARMRDFSELFFFAGASEEDKESFFAKARGHGLYLRQHGALWSLAVGASATKAIGEVAGLYERALHRHAARIGVATPPRAKEFAAACDRMAELRTGGASAEGPEHTGGKVRRFEIADPELWDRVLGAILPGPSV